MLLMHLVSSQDSEVKMTPLDSIRNGIVQKDWKFVIEGFLLLTGENLSEDLPILEEPIKPKRRGRPAKPKVEKPKPKPKPIKRRTVKPKPVDDEEELVEDEDDDNDPAEQEVRPSSRRRSATEVIEEGAVSKTLARTVDWKPKPLTQNRFHDDMQIHRSDLQTKAQKSKKIVKVKPRPFKKVTIECYSCNRLYKVNPSFIYDNKYRCERCCQR
jgi:hypothetical protein